MPTEPLKPPQDPLLARLDQIELHLRHMDSRDRLRMISSTLHTVINFLVLGFFLWTSWYVVAHMADLVKYMAKETATQSQAMMKSGSQDFMKQVQGMFQTK